MNKTSMTIALGLALEAALPGFSGAQPALEQLMGAAGTGDSAMLKKVVSLNERIASQREAEIVSAKASRVMMDLYVPVSPDPVGEIERRVGYLERKHGFSRDRSYEPVLVADSRERKGPIWVGFSVYRIRGWVSESWLAGLRNSPWVKAVSVWGAWGDEAVSKAAPAKGPEGVGVRRADLDVDSSDCVNGWLSMDVSLTVRTDRGTIRKSFGPSCNFTFSDRFSQDGVTCRLDSAMCSSFIGAVRIEVVCEGGDGSRKSDSESFPCPDRR